jgi:hypothetical protein
MRPIARFAALGAVLLPAACALPPPPSGPSILALPRAGTNYDQFRREETSCRAAASGAIAPSLPPEGTPPPNPVAPPPAQNPYTLQRNYDIAYAQCMSAAGHQVQGTPAPRPPVSAYAYPPSVLVAPPDPVPFYGPWWGLSFGTGPYGW